MRKFLSILFAILVLMSCLCSCSDTTEATEPVSSVESHTADNASLSEYLIPQSYFNFAGTMTPDDFTGLGNEYCTDAEATDDGIVVYLTDTQRDNLIERNLENVKDAMTSFEEANELYSYSLSDDFKSVELRFDENLSDDEAGRALVASISTQALNQLLSTGNPEWSVNVSVFNCHTGNLAVSGDLPADEFYLNAEAWERSYNE